ncbi:MAG: von Willebrand factor type A domain-containing protein [Flavisolibacter sp.]
MVRIAIILLVNLLCSKVYSQYYLRGEVTDDHGNKLQNVTIIVRTTQQVFRTGTYGDFGIISNNSKDTLSFSLDGFFTVSKPVDAKEYVIVVLKTKPSSENLKKNHLATFIKDFHESNEDLRSTGESYSTLVENQFIKTDKTSSATFAPNTNKASYSNIRRFLNMKGTVPPDAVRIEEMLNYFNFHYTEPKGNNVFNCSSYISSCPWNRKTELLYLTICARKIDMANVPPSNLVFLIDVSGSMDLPNKLPLLKSGLRLLINNLRDIDTVSLITYGAQVSLILDGVSGKEKKKMLDAIEDMQPAGSTPGEAGIRLAYKIAQNRILKDGNNRIILATDGDFNVGYTQEKDLEELIDEQKQSGIYLSCLGVGMGNYKDSKLSILAQKGHGNFSYIDNEQEAEKVFVTEWAQTLLAIADHVSITASFDPSVIKSYRLIGFENKKTALKDTTSKMEGGEIASGQSLLALFELVPNDDSMRSSFEIADIKITYRLPHQNTIDTIHYSCPGKVELFDKADTIYRQAACVAMFGMKLRQSKYASSINWKTIEAIAHSSFSTDTPLGNEYLILVTKAKEIYKHRRRRWW